MKHRARRAAVFAVLLVAASAAAGPVLVYREGPQFCPRDRPAQAPRISAAEAVERARSLLPGDFCGPSWYVSGCEFDPEWALESWRGCSGQGLAATHTT